MKEYVLKIRLKNTDEDKDVVFEEQDQYDSQEMDSMYSIVRSYLYEHQGENALQVSEATGVPRNAIMTFLRQGKISLAENSRSLLHPCKQCGALIENGDLCYECKVKKMNSILHPEAPSTKKNMSGYSAKKFREAKDKNYAQRIRNGK